MFRQDIQRLIESTPNAMEAAKLVCIYLDDQLDISGNGWFDDDPLLEALLIDEEQNGAYEMISTQVEQIVSMQSI